jgi:hypothetical protein
LNDEEDPVLGLVIDIGGDQGLVRDAEDIARAAELAEVVRPGVIRVNAIVSPASRLKQSRKSR